MGIKQTSVLERLYGQWVGWPLVSGGGVSGVRSDEEDEDDYARLTSSSLHPLSVPPRWIHPPPCR